MTEFIFTAKVGINADLFPDVLKLYAKPGDRIADVTYGKGTFWKKVDTSLYTCLFTDLVTHGIDMRRLPYPDKHLDMIIIDPPYAFQGGRNTALPGLAITTTYRGIETALAGHKAILLLYFGGLKEAYRTLKSSGFAVVKCQDEIEGGKQKWSHIEIYLAAKHLGFIAEDLFVMVQQGKPTMRHKHQLHARKNHSYFWVFRKEK